MEVIAYKGMNSDMTCRGFQYEIGKTYKTDKAELCKCGFHACLNPRDVSRYYPKYNNSCYFKVLLSGNITNCGQFDTCVAATEITILEEITDNFDEICKTTEWWKTENIFNLLPSSKGFASVQRCDGLYNFIDEQGNIISDEWFRYVCHFHDGFARVKRSDNLYNFINTKGKLLSDEWFGWCDKFYEGFVRVQRNEDNLWNFINTKGKLLSDEWFGWCDNFYEGSAVVRRYIGDYYKIDKTGELWK